jgi:hypothetical protein
MARNVLPNALFDEFFGNELRQQRARAILPILVRQALAGQPITYGDLTSELPDELSTGHRNLGGSLGLIGVTLNALSEQWREEIPHIQTIVVIFTNQQPFEIHILNLLILTL